MWQKTTLLLTLGSLLVAGGITAVCGPEPAAPEIRLDRSAALRMEQHMAGRRAALRSDSTDPAQAGRPRARQTALEELPARPGGAAPRDLQSDAERPLTLWLDGDSFAALPVDLGQQLGSGRLGVEASLALTSGRGVGEEVAADNGDLGIVSRSKPGASRRPRNGERNLGSWIPAFVAHPQSAVRNIPSRKLREILRGKLNNWEELRGPNAEIRLILPADDDARAMLARALIPGDELTSGRPALTEEQCLALAQTDLYTLTVVSLAAAERAMAKPLTIDGVAPSLSGRRRGTYPYGIDLALVEGLSPSPTARRALELLTGNEAELLLGSRLSIPSQR